MAWKSASSGTFLRDVLASIVVSLVALPLCMGIAIASGVPTAAGLITGIIAGLVVSPLSGVPLQVSGPAAGLVVIVAEFVQGQGLEQFGLVVLTAGLLQMMAGVARLGPVFRAVSPAVVHAMLAGIGVLIFASQFHVMVDDRPKSNGLENILSIPSAVQKAFANPTIPPPELRSQQRDVLQRVGELHRQQAHLHDMVSNARPGRIVTPEFIAEQQALVHREVDRSLEAAVTAYASQPEKQADIRSRAHELAVTLSELDRADKEGRLADAYALTTTAAEALERLLASLKNHELAAALGVLTIAVLALWKTLAPRPLQMIPSPLVAVILATSLAGVWQLPVTYVEVPDALWDEIRLPTRELLYSADWGAVLTAGLMLAVIASAETLLSATAVDQMHTGPRAQYDRELLAQGVGNVLCGLAGALPMTGVIVRSSANIHAGAATRLSAMLHGLWLLLFAAVFPWVLRMIPTAALAAVLVYTGYKLVDWKSAIKLRRYGWWEVFVYLATLIAIVTTDLLTGVMTGVALAVAKLAHRLSRLSIDRQETEPGQVTLRLKGVATFLRLPKLASTLESLPRGGAVSIDIERLNYVDHACYELLVNWARQYECQGGQTRLNWPELARLAGHARPPVSQATGVSERRPKAARMTAREPARL